MKVTMTEAICQEGLALLEGKADIFVAHDAHPHNYLDQLKDTDAFIVRVADKGAIDKETMESSDSLKVIGRIREDIQRILHQHQVERQAEVPVEGHPEVTRPAVPKRTHSEKGIIVEGLSNCLVKFSKCCTPVPGDDIVGFITKGYGVSVHRCDCPNASEEKRKEQPGRWIKVSWGSDTNDSYPTSIEVVCKDRLNLLLDISSALSTTKTFVLGLNTRSTEDGFAIIRIEIQIKDGTQLSTLMNKLHQISGVLQVNRPVG